VLFMVARGHRRLGAFLAGVVAISVGLATVYLGTHWLSDVVAGWCAGGLVLLALPVVLPWTSRAADRVRAEVAVRRTRRTASPPVPVARPYPAQSSRSQVSSSAGSAG
jgi:undecaprenyl-diphosphatase